MIPIGIMLLRRRQNLHRHHWEAFARQLGVSPRLVQRLIRSQAERRQETADAAWHDAFQDQHGEFPAPYSRIPNPK